MAKKPEDNKGPQSFIDDSENKDAKIAELEARVAAAEAEAEKARAVAVESGIVVTDLKLGTAVDVPLVTVQARRYYRFGGRQGSSRNVLHAAPFFVEAGDIVRMPRTLYERLAKKDPDLFNEEGDFEPKVLVAYEFNAKTGKREKKKHKIDVARLLESVPVVGLPAVK